MEKINVGIVGLGAIAKNVHIPVLSTFPDVQISCASEVDLARGEKIAAKWGIEKTYSDYTEMYKDSTLDAVFICLPSSLHYDAVRQALESGLNVFCEKPMTVNSEQAYELVKLANDKKLKLSVGYNRRFYDNYQDTAALIKSYRMGKIFQVQATLVNPGPYIGWIPSSDWFFKDKYGVLFDSGPHLIDMLLYLLGDQIDEVSATGLKTMGDFDIYDNISGTFRTNNGTIGTYTMGWRAAFCYDSINIIGTGGSYQVTTDYHEHFHGGYGTLEMIDSHINNVIDLVKTKVKTAKYFNKPNFTFFTEDRGFIDCVKNNTRPLVTGEDALRVLEILDAIKISIESGTHIKVQKHRLDGQ